MAMVSSRFMVEEPDKLRMTLKTTATIADWEQLRGQLDSLTESDTPLAYELRRQIRDMLTQVRTVYFPAEQS